MYVFNEAVGEQEDTYKAHYQLIKASICMVAFPLSFKVLYENTTALLLMDEMLLHMFSNQSSPGN